MAGDSVEAEIPAGNSPAALCAGGRYLYCANSAANSVTVIDPAQASVIATVQVGTYPQALCYDPLNDKVYCANSQSNDVSVLDCSTNAVIATFPAEYTPVALCHALSQSADRVYVADNDGSRLTVIRDSLPAGMSETTERSLPTAPAATIIRGVLLLPRSPFPAPCVLLDAAGRRVMHLAPGPNDTRHLSPGVYFIRSGSAAVRRAVVLP